MARAWLGGVSLMALTTDVLVIGAGPAGLTSGYLLRKAGRETIIVERDPQYVGGISRTVSYQSAAVGGAAFHFDIGGHRFFSKSREVVALWDEILPDDFIDRPRLSRIYYGGKFYSYPLRAFEALGNLGIIRSAVCVASYGWAMLTPVKSPKTFHEWVRNQFGEKLFSIFFKTYTEKVWGMSCDEISSDWAAQRIKGLDLGAAIFDALKRSFGIRSQGAALGESGGVKTLLENFRYPSHGPGMMWDAAAAKFRGMGGEIRMDRNLKSLVWDKTAKVWTATIVSGAGAQETITANHVISSAPITELSAAITPTPRSQNAAQSLRYRDFITVALIAKSNATFADNWVYIHDPSVRVGRVQNFLSWSPHMAPEGYACVGLEYFCFEGDGLWTSKDGDLIALAKDEIGKVGLIDPAAVIDACVVRQHKAYPIYDEAYEGHVDAVRADYAETYPTLHLVGRNGMHKYNNQDHAMMTAMLTVENILAGAAKFDVWAVNEDAEYTESGYSGAEEALKSERMVPRKVKAAA